MTLEGGVQEMRDANHGQCDLRATSEAEVSPTPEKRGIRANVASLARRWGPPLILILLCRATLLLLSFSAIVIATNKGFASFHQFLQRWSYWDAPHYLYIAEHGYASIGDEVNFAVFFPFYPVLTRFMAMAVGDYLVAGMLVSLVASLVATVLLYELVLQDFDRSMAMRSVWFMAVFPTAHFLIAPYGEATYLALTLAAFYAVRRANYKLSGLWSGLALLTRGLGVSLLPALVVEFQKGKLKPSPRLLWLGFMLVAGFLYLGLNNFVFGDPFAFQKRLAEHWFKRPAWPWEAIYNTFSAHAWRSPGEAMMVVWGELAFLAIVLAAGLVAWRWLRPSYAVYVLTSLLIMASTSYILSTPRYALGLFPIFIVMARLGRRELWGYGLSALSIAALSFLTIEYTLGRWAF